MNTVTELPGKPDRQHPLMIAAAIAVLLFCGVGTAAILGWIPNSFSGNAEPTDGQTELPALAQTVPQTPPLRLPAAPVAQSAPRVQQLAQAEAPANKATCGNCGYIESTRLITNRAQGSGMGAAGGAVLGGLLGNQIGGGNGRQLATVAGAVGGAVVGNQVEGNMNATRSYEIAVRLDDGNMRVFHRQSDPGWRNGQRVKIVNGALRSVN